VNGSLASKTVGVVGMGQIGSRLATWCATIGAQVLAYDPFAPGSRFTDTGATSSDLDALIDDVDILVVAVPPTPSADRMINAERIVRLRQGAIVATMTRTAALDVDALRERVLANEIFWTTDVYDTEPLPPNDPILGRDNVVHLPHIAGRTRDANIRLADILADDFIRIFNGDRPKFALTQDAVRIRTRIEP
jgi:D-3-phosphoglycerate dehydrogenase